MEAEPTHPPPTEGATTTAPIEVAVIGLGWIGRQTAEAALDDPRVRLVGVADIDASKADRDLGELIGRGRLGMAVSSDVPKLLKETHPKVAILCLGSRLEVLGPNLSACIAAGAHVVTDCERLLDPVQIPAQLDPALPAQLREAGLVVLATGANPGFSMDRLPLLLAQASRKIRRIRVQRVVRAEERRPQIQARIGLGMSPHHFRQATTSGEVGVPGLSTSVQLLARGLEVELDHTAESISPVLAASPVDSGIGTVASGQVRGVYQVARGYVDGRELITLELTIALGEVDPRDTTHIVGEPPLFLRTELPAEDSTVATLLSACRRVGGLAPGLRTVLDLPLNPSPATRSLPPEPSKRPARKKAAAKKATTKKKATAKKKAPAKKKATAKKKAPAKKPPTKKRPGAASAKEPRPRADTGASAAPAQSEQRSSAQPEE